MQVELLNFHKSGTPFYNRLSITPVFNEAGRLTNFIGIQEDVTALKESEETSRKLAREHLVYTTTVQAQQEEREALGKELHDNINQVLATSRLLLSMKTESVTEQRGLMLQSGDLINNAIEEIRRLSRRLVMPRSGGESLAGELKSLVNKLQPALPFPICLQINAAEREMTDETKLLFFRVIQEGINNCVKYANPTQLTLALGRRGNGWELLIKDDGAGFDINAAAEGIGLRNMRTRVEKAAGRFAVQSAPGRGCCLRIWVPLN